MAKTAATFSEWVGQELDAKLAEQPDDAARLAYLNTQDENWRARAARFVETEGETLPPHPLFGQITAWDLSSIASAIGARFARYSERCAA